MVVVYGAKGNGPSASDVFVWVSFKRSRYRAITIGLRIDPEIRQSQQVQWLWGFFC